jgi:hypothetical protein
VEGSLPLDLRARASGLLVVQRIERVRARRSLRRTESQGVTPEPFHFSHREALLRPLDRESWRGTDADRPSVVVVPTARPATAPRSGIALAARVALRHGCPLVVLVSHEAGTAAGLAALERQITVATDNGDARPDTLVLRTGRRATKLTSFGVDDLPVSRAYRRGGDVFGEGRLKVNDVGRKRNLALLLAAGMQWPNALLLDDDMFVTLDGDGRSKDRHPRTLDPESLRSAVRAVRDGEHLAVGWAAQDFDDNSVLCRIAGEMGAPQGQFIGAGALYVPVDARTSFFPSIYNEDWLFLLALRRHRVSGGAELLDGGDVHQDEYPAYLASRAAAEELGDVLGEGLASLLHEDGGDEAGSPSFWRRALRERCRFRIELHERVADSRHDLRDEMLKALRAMATVQERLSDEEDYWVSQLVTYSRVWRNDIRDWGRRLHPDDLPEPGRLLASREFEAARTFGRFERAEDFLREMAGKGAADAARSRLVAACP